MEFLRAQRALAQKGAFQATLLDQDGQPLSIGVALPEDGSIPGHFSPQDGEPLRFPENVQAIRNSSGEAIPISEFHRCELSAFLAYHFRLTKE